MRAEKDVIRTTSSAPMAIDGRAGKGRQREIASPTICRPDQSRAARPRCNGLEMRPNVRKVDETVDPAQHVIVRDVPLEAEAIETAPLASPAVRPSSTKSPVATTREPAPNSTIKRSFSTQFVDSSRLLCANSGHCVTAW
jgi:hypothetical protein